MYTCTVATKTISIDMEAYERLRAARRSPDESFSRVIKRAYWPAERRTASAFLEALASTPPPDREALDQLEEAQRADTPPADRWLD